MDPVELRNAMNAKRPDFTRSNKHKRKRVARSSWRAPRGLHNKEKIGFHGKKAVVGTGYRGPVAARGLSKTGLLPVLVHNLAELEAVDAKRQCAVLARVGMRKKLDLLKACKEKSIVVLGIDVDASLSRFDARLAERKKRKDVVKKRREVKKEKPAKEKKEPKKEEESDSEDKKESERKEMEKLLTKRE